MASQLEQALTRLRDNGRTMAELREKHKESVAEADRMEKALGRAQGELIRREKEISQMRMDMARLQQTANQVSPRRASGSECILHCMMLCW